MITSVDTNVLLDVFISDAPHHSQSQGWLRSAYDRGAILVCDVVYAELILAFDNRTALDQALRKIGETLSPLMPLSPTKQGCAGCDTDGPEVPETGLSPTS